MDRTEITEKLTSIFRDVFKDSSLELNDEMNASYVDNWDSLTHMLMITAVESEFLFKFKLKDLNKMKKVGDLIALIETKLLS